MIRIDEWHIRMDVNLDEVMYVRKGRMNVRHGGMDASMSTYVGMIRMDACMDWVFFGYGI